MKIKLSDPSITDVEKQTLSRMMDDGWDNYKYVEQFEADFAEWHERKFCLMTPSCTHAIHLALLALGVCDGDEVIVPDSTWTGSVAPVVYVGATPVFADIDPATWCLSTKSVEERITSRTKAIIAVDLYGNTPDYDDLEKLAAKYSLVVIEDAAEALGTVRKGIRAGKHGTIGVHSFHRTKTITCGEGGALLIDDPDIYSKANFYRDHGRSKVIPYFIEKVSPKYMPSNLQAALVSAQFSRIDELIDAKRQILFWYKENLEGYEVTFNVDDEINFNGMWATTIVVSKDYSKRASEIISSLSAMSVPSRPFFYPLTSMPAYSQFGSKNQNVNSVFASEYGLTLPSSYSVTETQVEFVTEKLKKILEDR